MTSKVDERHVSEMLEQHGVDTQEFPAEAIVTLLDAITSKLILDRLVGIKAGHNELLAMLHQVWDQIEPRAPAPRSRERRARVTALEPPGAREPPPRGRRETRREHVSESVTPWIVDSYVNANPPHLDLTWSLTDNTYGSARTESQDLEQLVADMDRNGIAGLIAPPPSPPWAIWRRIPMDARCRAAAS